MDAPGRGAAARRLEDQDFIEASRARREDLLVHLALQQFPGSPKYRSLPKSLQIDIKAFFKSHLTALAEGRQLLFAAGDRAGVRADVEVALAAGLGGLRRDRRFRFRSTALARLPARLRVVVGCAEVLQGGADACDFIDLDVEAPKVTMLTCDDVDLPVPCVVEKLRIDMARLRVALDKRNAGSSPIYFKSRYLPAGVRQSVWFRWILKPSCVRQAYFWIRTLNRLWMMSSRRYLVLSRRRSPD